MTVEALDDGISKMAGLNDIILDTNVVGNGHYR